MGNSQSCKKRIGHEILYLKNTHTLNDTNTLTLIGISQNPLFTVEFLCRQKLTKHPQPSDHNKKTLSNSVGGLSLCGTLHRIRFHSNFNGLGKRREEMRVNGLSSILISHFSHPHQHKRSKVPTHPSSLLLQLWVHRKQFWF